MMMTIAQVENRVTIVRVVVQKEKEELKLKRDNRTVQTPRAAVNAL